jgi:UDPglucose 6-dehydrogenase
VRTSPAIQLCQRLLKEGASLRVHDPKAMEKAKAVLPPGPNVEYVESMQAVADGCDAIAIATEWPEFGKLDWAAARHRMIAPIIFDGRNLLDRLEMETLGYIYRGVGR